MTKNYTKIPDKKLMDECAAVINELRTRNLFSVIITSEYFSDLDRIFNQTRNPDIKVTLVPVSDFVLAQNETKQFCVVPLPTLDMELEMAAELENEMADEQDTIH